MWCSTGRVRRKPPRASSSIQRRVGLALGPKALMSDLGAGWGGFPWTRRGAKVMGEEKRYYVGVDVGRWQHTAAVLSEEEAAHGWEQSPVFSFGADTDGFKRFWPFLSFPGPGRKRRSVQWRSPGGTTRSPSFTP